MARIQAVLIGLVALILTPGAFFYFDVTPKLTVLLAGASLLCLARTGVVDRRFSVLLALSLASAAISTALSSNPTLSLYGSTWRRFGLIAYAAVLVVAWSIHQTRDRAAVARGVGIAGALTAVYGIAQYFGYDPILSGAGYHVGEGIWTIVRPPGTLGYVSYFATWLLMCGFLALSWRGRAGYALAALCWSAMLLTGTRAAMLGLVAGLLIWLCRRGFRLSRGIMACAALVAVSAAAFYWSPAGWNLRSRTRWFVEDPWGGARPLLWRDSARMASQHLAVGHGPETFTAAFARAESADLARRYPDFAHESPHNIFLDALVAQGVPGLLCLVALCWYGWRGVDPVISAAFGAGLVAQQFTAITIPTALLFYATLALAAPKPSMPIRLPRFALSPVAAVFLIAAFRFAAADHSLARAQSALVAADLQSADTHYRDYERFRLPGASASLWYTRSLLALSPQSPDPLRRFQALQRASALPPGAEEPFNSWYTFATVRAAQGDAAATESALRNAITAKPNWFKPHWTLAQLLAMEGRRADALAEARTAASLNGGKNPEVAATLTALTTH
jgi:O-antigen ligase